MTLSIVLNPDPEVSFKMTAVKAERFCSWLIGIGGWAASNLVEYPIIHRLIRTHNPDNTVGIPRQDLVVTAVDGSKFFQIRHEFMPLFEAWQVYDRVHKEEPV